MATKKKVTKKVVNKEVIKDECYFLKMVGAIINYVGLGLYCIYNTLFAISAVGIVSNVTDKPLGDILKLVSRFNITESVILLGDVFLFELINYAFYLTKRKEAIVGMLIIEVIAFIVGGVKLGFGYPLIYVTILPIINGLINYIILAQED